MTKILDPAEQIAKYEFTPDKVLKMLGWNGTDENGYKYKAEIDYSSTALKEFKNSKDWLKNTQINGWTIKRKPASGGGQWEKVPQQEITNRLVSKGINNYASAVTNGLVVIYRPQQAGDATGVKPNDRIVSTPSSAGDGSLYSTNMNVGGMTIYYDVIGFKSNDEEWMQKLKFAQMCLLKECYEWTGHIF